MQWESFAEYRIREAEAAGEFDDLPGSGRPIAGIDEPLAENWWLKRKLKEEGLSILPPVLEARREIDRTRREISTVGNEGEVRRRLERLNDVIHQAMHSPVPGPPDGVMPIDVERELQNWRESRQAARRGPAE